MSPCSSRALAVVVTQGDNVLLWRRQINGHHVAIADLQSRQFRVPYGVVVVVGVVETGVDPVSMFRNQSR